MRRYHVFHAWKWEILSVIVAFGLTVLIAALLVLNHGKPVPDWGKHFSFNATLALASTVLRATLVYIASKVISQRKWEWYRQERQRPLSDLQKFDEGSRGTFGALDLLPTVIQRDAVALAAVVVMLTSFLIGPFVQQASSTVDLPFPVPAINASLPFANYVPRQPVRIVKDIALGSASQDLVAAILSAGIAPDGIENRISPTCATGSCTFYREEGENTTHSTAGICSKCVDISSLAYTLEETHNGSITSRNISLKNYPEDFKIGVEEDSEMNFHTVAVNGTSNLTWLGDLFTPELRSVSRLAYINSTVLASNLNKTVAAVCSLYPCLRTYSANITNNQLFEYEVDSEPMRALPNESERDVRAYAGSNSLDNKGLYHYAAIKPRCSGDGRVTDLSLIDLTDYGGSESYQYKNESIRASEDCIYRHDSRFGQMVSQLFNKDLFFGYCIFPSLKGHKISLPACFGRESSGGFDRARGGTEGVGMNAVLRAVYNEGNISYSKVTRWFDDFGGAMTNRCRSQFGAVAFNSSNPIIAYQPIDPETHDGGEALPPGRVLGTAWQTKTCVSMRGGWLLLPSCLTIVASLLTAWTIAKSWRHRYTRPVWKDSILPLIFGSHIIEPTQEETETSLTGRRPLDEVVGHGGSNKSGQNDETPHSRLMEASEMKERGGRILVTFRWPDGGKGTGLESSTEYTSAIPLQQRKGWVRLEEVEE